MARSIDRALRVTVLAMVAIALAYMMERVLIEEPENSSERGPKADFRNA